MRITTKTTNKGIGSKWIPRMLIIPEAGGYYNTVDNLGLIDTEALVLLAGGFRREGLR